MKLPELAGDLRRWDMWKAFHWGCNAGGVISTHNHNVPPFIIFETGEVAVTTNCSDVSMRHEYRSLDVRLVGTTDAACPALRAPDGRKLAKAWLVQNGLQHLLVDYDTGRVVGLYDSAGPTWQAHCPGRFVTNRDKDTGTPNAWKIRAWFPGAGQAPIGAGTITASVPNSNKEWVTLEEREHLNTLKATCDAMMTLKGRTRSNPHRQLPFDRVLKAGDLDELADAEIEILFSGGVGRKLVNLEYLELDR